MLQKKYYYGIESINNQAYTVEIWQNTTDMITATEIKGDVDPFVVQYPNYEKFTPVRGSGCAINLVSKYDRQFFSLYTANFFEFQIRLYKDSALIWTGYLDSELYTEDFSSVEKYSVSFSGTDGFALLDRLNYVDASKNQFNGIASQFTVLQTIISKLNLPYNNIYFNISTTSPEITIAANETILHKTFVFNSNYYNEDNEAETCRKVLESILNVYGAFIMQVNGSLYITDTNALAIGGTQVFKKYDNSFNYVGNESINLNIGDITNIRYNETSSNLKVVSGFNKQIIKYSPYIQSNIIDFKADSDFSITGSTINYKVSDYWWNEDLYTTSKSFDASNNGKFAKMCGVSSLNQDKTDYYLKVNKYGTSTGYTLTNNTLSFKYKLNLPTLIPSNYKIKVGAKAFVRTIDTLGNETADKTADMFFLQFFCRVKINDKKYCYKPTQNGANDFITNQSNGWKDLSSNDYYSMTFSKPPQGAGSVNQSIDNEWVDLNWYSSDKDFNPVNQDYLIPLNGFNNGVFEFEIYGFRVWPKWSDTSNVTKSDALMLKVKDVRIKDINFTIVDANNKEINTKDVEYVGYMNADYKDESSNINTYNGTNTEKNPVERGALMSITGTSYFFVQNWTRQGKTDIIENLLLRSIVSNYTNKTIELACTLNMFSSILGSLTYNNYLLGISLMPVSCDLNYWDEKAELTLQQINVDALEINKTFITGSN